MCHTLIQILPYIDGMLNEALGIIYKIKAFMAFMINLVLNNRLIWAKNATLAGHGPCLGQLLCP